jgi:biopolymer transport protein ExbD
MRRKRAAEADPYQTDLTPMIDLVFNLIVFFLVVSELSDLSLEEVALAPADQAQEAKPGEEILQLNVLGSGRVKIGGSAYAAGQEPSSPGSGGAQTLPPLRGLLELEAARLPREPSQGAGPGASTLRVNLRVDAATPFHEVHRVIGDCQDAEVYKVSLAASKEPAGP